MKHIFALLLFTGIYLNVSSQIKTPKMGYYGRASVGILTGEYANISFQAANGIFLGPVELGLALGLETHYDRSYVPILVESRYNFGKGPTQPFIAIGGGYLAAIGNINNYVYQGGYTGGSNIGITHYFSKNIGITTSIGYRFSHTHNRFPDYWTAAYPGESNVIKDMHRIEFRIGVAFR